mgnify:CR=1 FL=1
MKIDFKSEQGGVFVIVAVMFSTTLFLSVISMVVDGGVVYLERRTISNTAESAALALARECSQNPNSCAIPSFLQQLVNSNSPDGATEVTEICINGRTATGNTCMPAGKSAVDCSVLSSDAINFARVRTKSSSPDTNQGIKTFFSGAQISSLEGCAQAEWGNASSAPTYSPFAISICEWAKEQKLPRVLTEFTTSSGVSSCTYTFTDLLGKTFTRSGINGWAALDLLSPTLPAEARASVACPDPTTDTPANLSIGNQLNQITKDQSSSTYCGSSDLQSKMGAWLNQVLFLPLVSTAKISGGSTLHTVEGFAAFKLLGYSLAKKTGQSNNVGGVTPSGSWCPKSTNCIYGEFVSTFSSNSQITSNPGIPNIGLQAIELA